MEEATLTLYRVRQVGFYNDSDEHQFATLAETFQSMLRWAGILASIGESSTYQADEDSDILRAFCMDLRDLGGGKYLLATWNELSSVEEGVQILQVESKIGAADVSAIEIDAMSLPGYPAYFCVDTRSGRVLNIRFDQRLNGSRQFQRFTSGFLATSSPWCVWDEDDDSDLIGYTDEEDDDVDGDFTIVKGVIPRFSTSLVRTNEEESFIRNNVNDIRRIIRRATVDPTVAAHKVFLDSAFKLAGMPINNRLRADINFQYEFKTRLTLEKLEAVIRESESNPTDTWDDVGFKFARDSQRIHWLSGGIARVKRELPVRRLGGGLMSVDDLAEFLTENLQEVLDGFNE